MQGTRNVLSRAKTLIEHFIWMVGEIDSHLLFSDAKSLIQRILSQTGGSLKDTEVIADLQDLFEQKFFAPVFVSDNSNLSDLFTKPHSVKSERFRKLAASLLQGKLSIPFQDLQGRRLLI